MLMDSNTTPDTNPPCGWWRDLGKGHGLCLEDSSAWTELDDSTKARVWEYYRAQKELEPCAECGTPVETDKLSPGRTLGIAHPRFRVPTKCQPCKAREEAEHENREIERAERNQAIWDQSLPARQELVAKAVLEEIAELNRRITRTDLGRPDFNRALWDAVKGFRPDEDRFNLGIWGGPGLSKSRVSCLVAKAIIAAREADNPMPSRFRRDPHKRYVEELTPEEALTFARAHRTFALSSGRILDELLGSKDFDGQAAQRKTIEWLKSAPVLLVDDIDKLSPTPHKLGLFFGIADHRFGKGLCTIWTANTHPFGWLAQADPRFGGPDGGPIGRRIADEDDGALVIAVG